MLRLPLFRRRTPTLGEVLRREFNADFEREFLEWLRTRRPISGGVGALPFASPQGVAFNMYDSRPAIPGVFGTVIIQQGTAALVAGTVTVTLPVPYTSATSYNVLVLDGTATAAVGVGAKTTTTFVLNGTSTDSMQWTTIGY